MTSETLAPLTAKWIPKSATVVSDLLQGQFHDPVRVAAFNTVERLPVDASEDIAHAVIE